MAYDGYKDKDARKNYNKEYMKKRRAEAAREEQDKKIQRIRESVLESPGQTAMIGSSGLCANLHETKVNGQKSDAASPKLFLRGKTV